MRSAILGFVAGTAVLQTSAALPDAWRIAACALAALVLLLVSRKPLSAAPAGALLGFCWAALLAHAALSHQLDKADEGRDIELVGTVATLPHDFGQGVRFHLKVETVLAPATRVPPKLALSWYRGVADTLTIKPGERWRLRVRLQRPHGNANPHGFDYEAWLLGQGVRATGYVRAAPGNRRLDDFVPGIGHVVERGRAALRERIHTALEGQPYAGVIVALVVGDQRGIGQSDWDVFNRTGVSHLVAISGLHITMIAGLCAWVASALWRRSLFTSYELPLVLPAQKVAALAGAAAALLYVLLAGFGVPAQRTLYMLAVVAAALWTGRLASVSHILCLALGLVLLLDPWAVLWPGFWLSFCAVAVILYAGLGRGTPHTGLRGALVLAARTQYAVTLGLVPLTLLLFSQVSLVGPLANAVAIPVVSFVVTPLALAGSLLPAPLAQPVLWTAHFAIQSLVGLLGWLAALPLAVWSVPAPPPWLFALAVAGTAWMLAPRGWPHRWAGAAAWLPLFALQPTQPAPGTFAVTAFDVGQGMALLVETHGHRLLVDAGPQYAPGQNGGTRVILPYLRARGIGRLDGMIVTHSDLDHAGGARTLLEALEVGWVASSLGPGHAVVRAAGRHRRCEAGQRWEWDGVAFEMVQPSRASYDLPGLKPNARSCVLRVSNGSRAILLAADIEAAQEAQLVSYAPQLLRADVLLVPHHGSGTSSTPAFLAAVRPAIGVFQVGHRNRYRHPKREVYERYGALGIRRLRTDESGAISFAFGGDIAVRTQRSEQPRYWHGR
ncbi:MAG: competence protein ComEC [Massilia sp.]|jgi:competence protein ComEC